MHALKFLQNCETKEKIGKNVHTEPTHIAMTMVLGDLSHTGSCKHTHENGKTLENTKKHMHSTHRITSKHTMKRQGEDKVQCPRKEQPRTIKTWHCDCNSSSTPNLTALE